MQIPTFSGVEEFQMFSIDTGRFFLAEAKHLRAMGKRVEAKAMLTLARKTWTKDLYYFNKKQRGKAVHNFDTAAKKDTPAKRAARIEALAAHYAPQIVDPLIEGYSDACSPFPLIEVQCDDFGNPIGSCV